MLFLRKLPNNFKKWAGEPPDLASIRSYFRDATGQPSIYRVDADPGPEQHIQELEAVTGLNLKLGKPLDVSYGILLTEEDFDAVDLTPISSGTTGIGSVDERHFEFPAEDKKLDQFIGQLLKCIWQGEQRLRIYLPYQLLAQVAVFSKLPATSTVPTPVGEIHTESLKFCTAILAGSTSHSQIDFGDSDMMLTVTTKPDHKNVDATRPI